jgi:hypothetical protein
MTRLSLFAVLAVGLAAAPAQSPPPAGPKITLQASGGGTAGQGTVTASGNITLPAPWELSIHVVTVRYQKQAGSKTLNALIAVKGANFKAELQLKPGTYSVWAVIDVKDSDGREKQISCEPQMVTVP